MNKVVFSDNTIFDTGEYPIESEPNIFDKKSILNNVYREVLRITIINSTYELISQYFVNDAEYSIRQFDINEETGEELETYTDYDKFEYCLAGDIVDHRDGRFTVYMGKKTDYEIEMDKLEEENAQLLFENLTGDEFFDDTIVDEEIPSTDEP